MPADLIVLPGTVRTMDPDAPRAEALAVRGGKVLAVGGRQEVLATRGPGTEVLELPEACLLPGFHDAHVHLTQHGLELDAVRLADAATMEEGLARVAAAAAAKPPGTWLLGAGFALQRWQRDDLLAADLDRVAPHHPVLLRSQDHHSAWVNTAALRAAGVDAHTPDPQHGQVLRDERGQPSGLLLERALHLVWDRVPTPDETRLHQALEAAAADLASRGVTTVHHMSYEPPSYWRALAGKASRSDGRAYGLRVWACIPHADLEHAAAIGLATGQGGDFFQVGGAKFFADGALGSRTAWMLEPYPQGGHGVSVDDPATLRQRFELAASLGFTPVTHAIGDAANRAVIEALEATAPTWRAAGLRPRLEHAQHLHSDDLARLAALGGVVASMQPLHLSFDAGSIRDLLGDHLGRAYRFRDLRDAGVTLAFGSDTPVASPDVVEGLRAAVWRQDTGGVPFETAQALSADEALWAYTAGAAEAIGWQHRSGRLRVGADADLVLLDHDPVLGLEDLEVLGTFLAGQRTFGG